MPLLPDSKSNFNGIHQVLLSTPRNYSTNRRTSNSQASLFSPCDITSGWSEFAMSGLLKLRGRVAQAQAFGATQFAGILMLNHNGPVSEERRDVGVTDGP
jgi:hypothetical protein